MLPLPKTNRSRDDDGNGGSATDLRSIREDGTGVIGMERAETGMIRRRRGEEGANIKQQSSNRRTIDQTIETKMAGKEQYVAGLESLAEDDVEAAVDHFSQVSAVVVASIERDLAQLVRELRRER